jgi:hypothetical protein
MKKQGCRHRRICRGRNQGGDKNGDEGNAHHVPLATSKTISGSHRHFATIGDGSAAGSRLCVGSVTSAMR